MSNTIRELSTEELDQIFGGTGCDPCDPCCKPCPDDKDKKGNNGYGNNGGDGIPNPHNEKFTDVNR